MPIPAFQDFFLPFLKLIADQAEHSRPEIAAKIATYFKVSQEELEEILPSGSNKFNNRVAWARTYLGKAMLVDAVSRGRFKISQRGIDLLATQPEYLDVRSLKQYPEFSAFAQPASRRDDVAATDVEIQVIGGETPEERLETSYQLLRTDLSQVILQQVMQASPQFFEQLVVDLLVAMGYGGSRLDAGQAIGQSGDEGIDGVIKEDRLGLDVIYLQAKRWHAAVGRPQVQAFVGSLVGKNASKGVMLSTSRFTKDAQDYVRNLPQKVVLIDGEELANLMQEFNVGVAPVNTYMSAFRERDGVCCVFDHIS